MQKTHAPERRRLSAASFFAAAVARARLGGCCCLGLVLVCVVWGLSGCGGNVNNNRFREGYGGLKGTLFLPDGSPAAGTLVQVVNLPSLSTKTDADGRFELFDIPAGRRELVMIHKEQSGARIPVWIIHQFHATLDPALTTLKPVGQLGGRISARPRLDAKGIQVVVKGLPFSTKTHNAAGDFVFPFLPEGCHILQISSSYFVRKELPNVCVTSGKETMLSDPIALAPSVPCGTSGPSCASGGLCVEGFCVPDPGGAVALAEGGELSLGDVQLEMRQEAQKILLRNAGPGLLRISQVKLDDESGAFSIRLPELPVVLQKGESLSAHLGILGTKLGEHQASLLVKTNAPDQPSHTIKLKAKVLPHPSNCLSARPGTLELGELDADVPHTIEVTVANRCGQTLLIEAGQDTKPSGSSCAPSWLGYFSLDVCISSSQKLPVKVPPGDAVKLSFRLTPKAYGALSGELYLPHDETPGGRLQIPLSGFVKAPGLRLTPHPLDFGDVAPDETRTLWLQLQSDKPLSAEQIKALKLSLDASGARIFAPLSSRIARLPQDPKVIYLPIALRAPVAGRLLAGRLQISGLPGLGERSFTVPLKARITAPTAPALTTELALGSTDGCRPPAQTLWANNPTEAPIQVTEVSLQAGVKGDFALRAELPVVVLPGIRTALATVQLTPSAKAMRAYGQLKVTLQYDEGKESQRIVSLQGATGFQVHESFRQTNSANADVLMYVDPSIDAQRILPMLEEGLTTMLKGLNTNKVNYRLLPMTLDGSGAGLSPLTPNPINELRRLLQPSSATEHQGLAAMNSMLQRRNAPANTTTAAIFVSDVDDRSPYAVTRYLPQPGAGAISVFAALPQGRCSTGTHRYQDAVERTGGAVIDLCTAPSETWKLWGGRIQRLLTGQRLVFPLRAQPKGQSAGSIQLATPQHKLPQEQWSYDPETNEVSLGHPAFLPPGEQLTISYYTRCE